jgi:hypothetical protein
MSAAEGRTANRVQVPEGEQERRDCACALCIELARALPEVREIFRNHARLFRENAELKLQLHEARAENERLLSRAADLQQRLAARERG